MSSFVYPDSVKDASPSLPDGVYVYVLPQVIVSEGSIWDPKQTIRDAYGIYAKKEHQFTVKGGVPVEISVKHFSESGSGWEIVGTFTDQTTTLLYKGILGFRFRATGGDGEIKVISE